MNGVFELVIYIFFLELKKKSLFEYFVVDYVVLNSMLKVVVEYRIVDRYFNFIILYYIISHYIILIIFYKKLPKPKFFYITLTILKLTYKRN